MSHKSAVIGHAVTRLVAKKLYGDPAAYVTMQNRKKHERDDDDDDDDFATIPLAKCLDDTLNLSDMSATTTATASLSMASSGNPAGSPAMSSVRRLFAPRPQDWFHKVKEMKPLVNDEAARWDEVEVVVSHWG
mmetsp:Transcript_38287/g.114652  ORF Transcript_38287/g.114652 Transcript_38287/m.114652 type:complete len:133 (-) Transcript_38287:66-464(-)